MRVKIFDLKTSMPFSYVATNVAKLATFWRLAYSSRRCKSRVRIRDCNLSAQNLENTPSMSNEWRGNEKEYRRGLLSMYVMSFKCCKKDNGVSATTWRTRIRVWTPALKTIYHRVGCQTLMYSTNRFRKAMKCSAFLILPGIASFSRSSGSTISIRCELNAYGVAKFIQGFPINSSVSFWSMRDSCNPSTSFAYSSCSLATSLVLILFK